MEVTKIDTMHQFITKLRSYFNLIKQEKLSESERERKNKLEVEISMFLNQLDSFAMYDAGNAQINYSLDMMKRFFTDNQLPDMPSIGKPDHPKAKTFSQKLNELMKERKVQSRDVIDSTGINQSVFSKIKSGMRKPSMDVTRQLSAYFNCDLYEYE